MWDCLLLFQPAPLGVPASTQHLDASLVAPSVHDHPDHVPAYVRTEPLQIRNSEWALYVCQGVFDQAGFGSARGSFSPCAIFELAVSPAQGRKKIGEPYGKRLNKQIVDIAAFIPFYALEKRLPLK
jgi:hypothetical protein